VAGAGVAGWFGYPAIPVIWIGLVVAAWMEPSAELTGPKDSYGYPTAAGPGEAARKRQERFFRDLRFRLLIPNGDWMPGWPLLASWVSALVAAAFGAAVPVVISHQLLVALHGQRPKAVELSHAANALLAFVLVAQVPASYRRTAEGGRCPGVRFDTLWRSWRSAPAKMAAGTVGGAVVGFGIDLAVRFAEVRYRGHLAATLTTLASPATTTAVTVGGGLWLGMVAVWTGLALAAWRRAVEAEAEWKPRWRALKVDPAPRVVDRVEHPPATLDIFEAPATGAGAFWPMGLKIAPTLGAGSTIAVLEVPDETENGPAPGTRHPLRFAVARWPGGLPPMDVTAPGLSRTVAELYAHCAMVWALEPKGYGRPVPLGVEALSSPDSPVAVWASRWAWPAGPSLVEVRPLAGDLSAAFGCPVLVDHRSDVVYFGAIGDDRVVWADPEASWGDDLAWLAEEDEWDHRWAAVLKTGANPPVPQRGTKKTFELAEGQGGPVQRMAFLVRSGVDPSEFRGLEARLATALDAAPYVAICGWPGKGDRPGERHPQAFVVYWSTTQVPGPTRLGSSPGARLVLAGAVNSAFDAAKLPRPEVTAARCLSVPRASVATWEIGLRLHGGITLADVRSRSSRLAQHLGAPWLRLGDGAEGARLYVGEAPERASLADEADRQRLVSLDWERAWSASGVVGAGGELPSLVEVGSLPANRAVEALDFAVPPGVSRAIVKAALPKLADATGYGWVDLRPSPHGASHYRVLASREMPIPTRAAVDFDAIDAAPGLSVPFATGIEGDSVGFDPASTPHALIAGATGSGKSSCLQSLIYGLVSKGASLVVVDPTKGGADFRFAEPWSLAFAATIPEAATAIRAVYQEVMERKNRNAAAGVGSSRDLPDPPPPLVVLVDEFTSLVLPEPVPKIRGDFPEAAAELEAIEELNAARVQIGSSVSRIAREARSANVILLLATQKLSAKLMENVPGGNDLKDNLGRCLLGQASSGTRMSALRSPEEAPELSGDIPPGRGLWEPLTSTAQIVQSWYAPQNEYAAALEARRPRLDPAERIDLSKPAVGARPAPGRPQTPTTVEESDEVVEEVDLGEVTFSMDDLDLSLDAAGSPAPDPDVPAEPDAGTGEPPDPSAPFDPWAEPLTWDVPAGDDTITPPVVTPPVTEAPQPDVNDQAPGGLDPWDEPLDWDTPDTTVDEPAPVTPRRFQPIGDPSDWDAR